MTENTTPENQAEIAALNHEIYRLSCIIDENAQKQLEASAIDCSSPFGNPTEYKDYSGDYSEILPEIKQTGFEIPLEPDFNEKRRIKFFYAVGGGCAFLRFVLADWLASLLLILISRVLVSMNPDADGGTILSYIKGSAIFASVNLIVFLIANVVVALVGMMLSKVKFNDLIKTRDYSIWTAVHHCLIAVFLMVTSLLVSGFVEDIFSHYGSTTNVVNLDGTAVTAAGTAIMLIYRCIIAPVTEEFFFRGMLLKTFSKANQRFGVFATAVFFGLAHSNIPQFILAFIIGIFLAHITQKHNSIIPAIVVHIFVNLFTTIIGYLNLEGMELGIFNMIYITVAALGAIMFAIFRISDKIPATTPHQSRRGLSVASASVILVVSFWLQLLYMLSFVIEHPALQTIQSFL